VVPRRGARYPSEVLGVLLRLPHAFFIFGAGIVALYLPISLGEFGCWRRHKNDGVESLAEALGLPLAVALSFTFVLRHSGHADKFVGDGLMAIFGAPERHPDHADRALAAATEIAACVRERFGDRLRVGVGVTSGRAVVGTGGGGRLDSTVIGDTVNTAARVESATRATGDDVLITEATRQQLTANDVPLTERQTLPLKGKSETVRLYAPIV
jgi:class 3 adenylate cyclase